MAKTSTLTLAATILGDGVNFSFAPQNALANTSAPEGGTIPTALASGDNTLAVPAGAMWLMLIPPTTSAVVKKLKGAGGDTGVTLSPSAPALISLAASQATVIINAGSTETVQLLWL